MWDDPLPTEAINALKPVVRELVTGDYASVVGLTGGQRLSADDIRTAVRQYGRTLIPPPEEAFSEIDAVRVRNDLRPEWSVRLPLWTAEEGRSDLSLEVSLMLHSGQWVIQLDDIHVL